MRNRIRRARPLAAAGTTALLAVGALTAGCGADPAGEPRAVWSSVAAAAASGPQPSAAPSTAAPDPVCSAGAAWDCAQLHRFAAAEAMVAGAPGKLGVIVHDRTTGAVWRTGTTTNTTWTASTVKLAVAAALLEWNRAGTIALTAADRAGMHAMLNRSDNDATTALWSKYRPQAMFDRFRGTYGMGGLSVVPGYTLFWRNLRCSAEDLHNLMAYVLDHMSGDDRAYLLDELRGVASNQRWGVWAAGSAMRPGNKDGWAQKPDTGGAHWVTHTVGFAGTGERYVVAATYSLPPSRTMSHGIHTVSDVVATVFGAPVPASISTP